MPKSSMAKSHPVHLCRNYNPGRVDKSAVEKPEVKWVRMALRSASDSRCAPT